MTSNIQQKIKHVIVLMMENRSFDNLIGWLYDDETQPKHFLPEGTPPVFNGLAGTSYANPPDLNKPGQTVLATPGVDHFQNPDPKPNEDFKYMNRQLFGLDVDMTSDGWLPPDNAVPSMRGFLADYGSVQGNSPETARQLMQSYTPRELSALSSIARAYAVSDNYHASCPTQTWPNRAFMHAGTSLGHVNNMPYLPYSGRTIYNVLEEAGVSWNVYTSSEVVPSLTRIQMMDLWNPLLDGHFHTLPKFLDDCRNGNLPAYSFIEPSFLAEVGTVATSEHPPADVCSGDHFLATVCNAVVGSPAFGETLFIINYDEHGGCPDHVPPNWTAVTPDEHSSPGKEGFRFNRFGVRVPAILVSPHIPAGTVVRANADPWNNSSVPFDHTSILAMILDWQSIDRSQLPSRRVQAAPPNPFDEILAGERRTDRPQFSATCTPLPPPPTAAHSALSSLQASIVAAHAHYDAWRQSGGGKSIADHVHDLLKRVTTEAHMLEHFASFK